tara:strand:- start:1255 stop:3522 length:2268 start_codon:yes stop_codon:yes gene_type:complete
MWVDLKNNAEHAYKIAKADFEKTKRRFESQAKKTFRRVQKDVKKASKKTVVALKKAADAIKRAARGAFLSKIRELERAAKRAVQPLTRMLAASGRTKRIFYYKGKPYEIKYANLLRGGLRSDIPGYHRRKQIVSTLKSRQCFDFQREMNKFANGGYKRILLRAFTQMSVIAPIFKKKLLPRLKQGAKQFLSLARNRNFVVNSKNEYLAARRSYAFAKKHHQDLNTGKSALKARRSRERYNKSVKRLEKAYRMLKRSERDIKSAKKSIKAYRKVLSKSAGKSALGGVAMSVAGTVLGTVFVYANPFFSCKHHRSESAYKACYVKTYLSDLGDLIFDVTTSSIYTGFDLSVVTSLSVIIATQVTILLAAMSAGLGAVMGPLVGLIVKMAIGVTTTMLLAKFAKPHFKRRLWYGTSMHHPFKKEAERAAGQSWLVAKLPSSFSAYTQQLLREEAKKTKDYGRVGHPCLNKKCVGDAWCSQRENRCYETCFSTPTRSGNRIPRKNRYFCDYGREKPVGRVGGVCQRGRCAKGAWCSRRENRCYETCLDTPTRSGNRIPRKNRYFCDYGNEKPGKRIQPARPKGYVGCYLDKPQRDLSAHLAGYRHTPASCIKVCAKRGFPFAGVQDGGQCFCGNRYGKYGKRSGRECSKKCASDRRYLCGHAWRNEVYKTGATRRNIKYTRRGGYAIHCARGGCLRSGPGCNTSWVRGQCSFPNHQAKYLCAQHPQCKAIVCNRSRRDCQARRGTRLTRHSSFNSYILR